MTSFFKPLVSNPELAFYGSLAGIAGYSYLKHYSKATNPTGQIVDKYTNRHHLAGLAAGVAHYALLGKSSGRTSAAMVGLAAMVGGAFGDARETSLSPTAIITGNALTGVAAFAAYQFAGPAADVGVATLKSFLAKKEGLLEGVEGWVSRLRTNVHPVFQKYISKAGAIGIATSVAIPVAHKVIQRFIAHNMRAADTLNAKVNEVMSDNQVPLVPRDADKYVPGSLPPKPSLSMKIMLSDHDSAEQIAGAFRN